MKQLQAYAWVTALVVFVGTFPHAVGAMYIEKQTLIKTAVLEPCWTPVIMAKNLAKEKVLAMYPTKKEWSALSRLWGKESAWNHKADNPHSSAYGIPQMLNMKPNTSIERQIDLGLKYIQHRYGTPTKALAFHDRHGWY